MYCTQHHNIVFESLQTYYSKTEQNNSSLLHVVFDIIYKIFAKIGERKNSKKVRREL